MSLMLGRISYMPRRDIFPSYGKSVFHSPSLYNFTKTLSGENPMLVIGVVSLLLKEEPAVQA
jgi:hypothetical protein